MTFHPFLIKLSLLLINCDRLIMSLYAYHLGVLRCTSNDIFHMSYFPYHTYDFDF
uniref:Uncharacterized protein n=1 Tax=Octopus bimaculoides TaxID=37653 RepID=A0A0L8G0Y4_OCTBM